MAIFIGQSINKTYCYNLLYFSVFFYQLRKYVDGETLFFNIPLLRSYQKYDLGVGRRHPLALCKPTTMLCA